MVQPPEGPPHVATLSSCAPAGARGPHALSTSEAYQPSNFSRFPKSPNHQGPRNKPPKPLLSSGFHEILARKNTERYRTHGYAGTLITLFGKEMKTIQKSLAIAAGIVGVVGYSGGSDGEAWSTKSILIGLFLCAGMVYTMIRHPERITWLLVLFIAPLLAGLVAYEAINGSTKSAILTFATACLFLGIQAAFVVLVSSRMESGVSAPTENTETEQDVTPNA